MNILYILGNGFDINLNIPTSYSEFYNFYRLKSSDNELIKSLKKEIILRGDLWSDLEEAFGLHTEKLKTRADFELVHDDLLDNMAEYLSNEEQKFDTTKLKSDLLNNYLINPEDYTVPGLKSQISEYKNRWKEYEWNIDVYTLNYTKIFEKILSREGSFYIGTHHNRNVKFRGIKHIHGSLDRGMVLGVNDKSQIGNMKFRNNPDVTDSIVKPQANQVQKHNIDSALERSIEEANLIVLFGVSMGVTDRIWWYKIINRIGSDCLLLVFKYDSKFELRKSFKVGIIERAVKNKLMAYIDGDSEERKEEIEKSILVSVNSDIFSFDKEQ